MVVAVVVEVVVVVVQGAKRGNLWSGGIVRTFGDRKWLDVKMGTLGGAESALDLNPLHDID